jgi:hypothetical protein
MGEHPVHFRNTYTTSVLTYKEIWLQRSYVFCLALSAALPCLLFGIVLLLALAFVFDITFVEFS